MAQRGRKPLAGVERGASGRIKTTVYRLTREERQKATGDFRKDVRAKVMWQRLKMQAPGNVLDPLLGTLAGRMFLCADPHPIGSGQLEAFRRYCAILADYETLVLGIRSTVQAQDLTKGIKGVNLAEIPAHVIRDVTEKFMHTEHVLGCAVHHDKHGEIAATMRLRPSAAASAVKALAREEGFPYGVLATVQGLTALAADMGLYDVDEDARMARVKAAKAKDIDAAG
jgi:hypothetical protein